MKAIALAAVGALSAPAVALGCALPTGAAGLMAEAAAAMNSQRAAGGRAALTRDARLDKAAQDHACWMAETNTFSHKGAGGSLPKRRIKAAGYSTRLSAENIAFGQTSGAELIREWMGTSGHRENILRPEFRRIGIAVIAGPLGLMTVQVFTG